MDLSGVWDYVQLVADRRRDNNRTPWHIDVKRLETVGAAGELAARQFLGLSIKLHLNFDGGQDLVWKGWRVDVKATRLTPFIGYRYLQWPIGKPIKCDFILMTAVDEQSYQAIPIGYATAEEVKSAPINRSRSMPCHEIPVSKLHPLWELFTLPPRSGEDRSQEQTSGQLSKGTEFA